MRAMFFLLIAAHIVWSVGIASGQDSDEKTPKEPEFFRAGVTSLIQSINVGDMVRIAEHLREASESLAEFGESMKAVSSNAAESVISTSQNLAAIGGEFDPFGFKTAFKTIQQQNAIIQSQHEIIMKLQQQEIQRLKQANKPSNPLKRQSRRKRPPQSRKSTPEGNTSE